MSSFPDMESPASAVASDADVTVLKSKSRLGQSSLLSASLRPTVSPSKENFSLKFKNKISKKRSTIEPPKTAVTPVKSMARASIINSRTRTSVQSIDKKKSLRKAIRNGNSGPNFVQYDIPTGFLPPAFRNCHLSNVLLSARRCLDHLKEVRETLSNLVGEDEQLSKGLRKVNPEPHIINLSRVAEILTVLTREAFVPAHRLNQTAVALYNAEDFLRYPTDLRTFDTVGNGRIKLPEQTFNHVTLQKLRTVVDKSAEFYNKFDQKGGKNGAELQDILFSLMRALQDLHTLALGCQDVFKVLLYMSQREKLHLQQYLLSLQSMERSDMLTEVQDLRRIIDELVIFVEKLSWGSFVVFRLGSGKNPNYNLGTHQEEQEGTKGERDLSKVNAAIQLMAPKQGKGSAGSSSKATVKASSTNQSSIANKEKFTSNQERDRDYIFGTNSAMGSKLDFGTSTDVSEAKKLKKKSKVSLKAKASKAEKASNANTEEGGSGK